MGYNYSLYHLSWVAQSYHMCPNPHDGIHCHTLFLCFGKSFANTCLAYCTLLGTRVLGLGLNFVQTIFIRNRRFSNVPGGFTYLMCDFLCKQLTLAKIQRPMLSQGHSL